MKFLTKRIVKGYTEIYLTGLTTTEKAEVASPLGDSHFLFLVSAVREKGADQRDFYRKSRWECPFLASKQKMGTLTQRPSGRCVVGARLTFLPALK